MTFLITNWYRSADTRRQSELDKSFKQNIANKKIDCILAVYEPAIDTPPEPHDKVCPIKCDERPTFAAYFDLANAICGVGNVVIIANLDIWFPEKSIEQIDAMVSEDSCLAMGKYNNRHGVLDLVNQVDSQDSWCFRTPIRPIEFADFGFGQNGCDNRLAYELDLAGYNVFNPAKTIISVHEHQSVFRTISADRTHLVPKPYKLLPVTE